MQEAVDSARAMVEDAGNPVDATKEGVKNLLAHSHKLAYTSFAPLLGPQLVDPQQGIYMPPFPQTIQLQQTFLKQYAQCAASSLTQYSKAPKLLLLLWTMNRVTIPLAIVGASPLIVKPSST